MAAVLLLATSLCSAAPAATDNIIAPPNTNIVINDIDIGYDSGDYFTKNGKSCACNYNTETANCHCTGICIDSTYPCNCMRYWPTGNPTTCEIDLRSTQCMGFATYCQWKVYGVSPYDSPENFAWQYNYTAYTAESIKAMLLGCEPATHIRFKLEHSIVVISTSECGILVAEANANGDCRIRKLFYRWEDFAYAAAACGGIDYTVSISSEFLAEQAKPMIQKTPVEQAEMKEAVAEPVSVPSRKKSPRSGMEEM